MFFPVFLKDDNRNTRSCSGFVWRLSAERASSRSHTGGESVFFSLASLQHAVSVSDDCSVDVRVKLVCSGDLDANMDF